jgi:Trp operon repressor
MASVYIEFNADLKPFKEALANAQNLAEITGKGAAANFHNAFSLPLRNLSRDFATTMNSLKLKEIALPDEAVKKFSSELGLAEEQYKKLAERITKNTAMTNAEKAFKNIASAAQLSKKEFKALGEQLGFSKEQINKLSIEIAKTNSKTSVLEGSLQKILRWSAGFVIIKETFSQLVRSIDFVNESLKKIANIKIDAANMGLDTQTYSEFSYVAERAGLSVDSFAKSFENLQKSAAQAVNGNKEKLNIFKALNIDLKEFIGLKPEEQLIKTAKALNGFSQGDKLTIADKLFGGSGRELIGLLQESGAEIERLFEKAKTHAPIFSDDDIRKAKQAAEAYADMKASVKSLAAELDIGLAPAIKWTSEGLAALFNSWNNSEFDQRMDTAKFKKYIELYSHAHNEALKVQKEIEAINSNSLEGYLSKRGLEERLNGLIPTINRSAKALRELGYNFKDWNEAVIEPKELKVDLDADAAAKDLTKLNKIIDDLNDKSFAINFKDEPLKLLEKELDGIRAQIADLELNEIELLDFEKAIEGYKKAREGVIAFAEAQKRAAEEQKRLKEQHESNINAINEQIDKIKKVSETIAEINARELPTPDFTEFDKFTESMQNYADSIPSLGEAAADTFTKSMSRMADSVADFASTGKLDFKGFVDSVIADMIRMSVQQAVLKPLFNAIGAGEAHTGGVVGSLSGAKRDVSPLLFANAPRFHSGGVLGSGEYPIIAKRGEGIFTPEQMRALSPSQPQVNVNVQNNANAKVTVKQSYNGNGGVNINARIEDAMTAAAANRSSKFNQALNGSRRLVRR